MNEHFCWFVVPEMIIGVPKYDQGACIAYIMDKLKENGFSIRYIHPNTLFISWLHWVPSYIRTELKNKTGIVINEYGKMNTLEDRNEEKITLSFKGNSLKPMGGFDIKDTNEMMLKNPLSSSSNVNENKKQSNKNYKSIQTYQPSGNLF